MILDAFLQFDAAINLAQIAGTYNSTNVIDLGITSGIPSSANGGGARDIGIGDDPTMKLLVQVTTAFTSAGAATLQVTLQSAIDNGSGAPAAYSNWYSTPVYALATLVQGARLMDMDFPRPPDGVAIPRFLRLQYVIGTATTTAGIVEALIILDRMDQFYSGTNNAVLSGYQPGITVAN
jgi:hypothetical protein